MKWTKAIVVGAVAALVMFIVIFAGIHWIGIAPFNQPPSAVFLEQLGMNVGPLPLIVHFAYGIFWSVVLVAIFGRRMNVWHGAGLGVALWLIMMAIYSPIMGWGVFGAGGSGHDLASDHPMYIGSAPQYAVVTLLVHLIYGGIVGWLNPLWLKGGAKGGQAAAEAKSKETGGSSEVARHGTKPGSEAKAGRKAEREDSETGKGFNAAGVAVQPDHNEGREQESKQNA